MRNVKYTWIGLLLLALSSFASAAPLNLSSAPLSVSSNALPNIMLLVDNSGSMNALIEESGYTGPSSDVNQWQSIIRYQGDYYWSNIDLIQGYLTVGAVYGLNVTGQNCDNNNGWKTFRRISTNTIKCVRLPTGVGDDGQNAINGNTRYASGYITYLLNTYAGSSGSFYIDLTGIGLPTDYRMNVARTVAKQIIEQTNNDGVQSVRFGLSSFEAQSRGSIINAECGAPNSELTSAIDSLNASTSTPLAESLYEITRYFRGMRHFYTNTGQTYSSPIQYRCQQNFAIIITDGFPTYDSEFPSNQTEEPFLSDGDLPDWDGLSPGTNYNQYPSFPQFSDGWDTNGQNIGAEGSTLYLDDIAKFANDIDFFDGNSNDLDGKSFDDAGFAQQNLNTYVVGFATNNTMLQDASDYGDGEYYQATNADQLLTALNQAVRSIISRAAGAGSAASSSGSIQEGTLIYQTRFNSGDWSGQLLAFDVGEDGSLESDADLDNLGAKWEASELIPDASDRRIYSRKPTYNGGGVLTGYQGVDFTYTNFSDVTSLIEDYFDYIRGENVDGFRERASKLGDIVNSTPKYVGAPDSDYDDTDYASFVSDHQDRDPMIYVGANDGMLHAFDAETGVEEFAFIPNVEGFANKFVSYADESYNHTYFVDGTPTVLDAKVDGDWKTVLVGGLNYGGKSIYALDVTNPTTVNASELFMWEFSHDDLGFTFSQPLIVKMNDGKWYVVFGSGYNPDNSDGDGRIFIVDIDDGSLVATLSTDTGINEDPTGQGRPNGIAKIAPVDLNNDGMVDYIYTGDLFGNLWKFKLTSSNKNNWDLAYKLFSACADNSCTSDNVQAITTQPVVKVHSSGRGAMVYFGTGKYLETTDNNGADGGVQTIYGIWDLGGTVSGRDQLTEQTIDFEGDVTYTNDTESNTYTMRVVSNNEMADSSYGWYLDLVSPTYGEQGERLITDMVLRRGYLYFYTSIPEADTCNPSGDSWFFILDAESGASPSKSQFKMDECEGPSCEVECSGNDCPANPSVCKNNCSNDDSSGGASKPVILPNRYSQTEDDCGDAEVYSGSSTSSMTVDCGAGLGRQSWRQYFQ
jgi:type IV pilus assembly protein PilY1